MSITVPIVEIANYPDSARVRRPYDKAYAMDTVIHGEMCAEGAVTEIQISFMEQVKIV